jgi:hypothetical protein
VLTELLADHDSHRGLQVVGRDEAVHRDGDGAVAGVQHSRRNAVAFPPDQEQQGLAEIHLPRLEGSHVFDGEHAPARPSRPLDDAQCRLPENGHEVVGAHRRPQRLASAFMLEAGVDEYCVGTRDLGEANREARVARVGDPHQQPRNAGPGKRLFRWGLRGRPHEREELGRRLGAGQPAQGGCTRAPDPDARGPGPLDGHGGCRVPGRAGHEDQAHRGPNLEGVLELGSTHELLAGRLGHGGGSLGTRPRSPAVCAGSPICGTKRQVGLPPHEGAEVNR